MHMIKKAASFLTAAVMVFAALTASAAENGITFRSFKENGDTAAVFTDLQPITVNDRVLVPLRPVCEAAGMSVSWYQPALTASITLTASADSAKPVERYAYNLLTQAMNNIGLDVEPKDITLRLAADVPTMDIRYNYTDTVNNDTISLGKVIYADNTPVLRNNSSIYIPVRSVMEAFTFKVSYNAETDTTEISIPNAIMVPYDLKILPAFEPLPDSSAVQAVTTVAVSANDPVPSSDSQKGEYLGRFKITHYCPCSQCNGSWGNNTAWAGEIIPGQTVAVSRADINDGTFEKLEWIYIDGYGLRRVEDTGGGLGDNHIDIAVSNHDTLDGYTNGYRDVWIAK